MFDETLMIIVDKLIASGLDEEQALKLVAELLGSVMPFDRLMERLANISSVFYS